MKSKVQDLACFGGSPAFADKLIVGAPNLGNRHRLLERIHSILDRNQLTNDGPFVRELEVRVAELVGVNHCVAVCNGTMALMLAAKAAGLFGEVILPSFTFIGTVHALAWLGITPVFCDIESRRHNIDPGRVERAITPRTTGIIGVHLWGRACAIDQLTAIARRHRLTLLFDAAHAFACSYRGQMIGSFGRAEAFSFHATKFCNAFEGGAVVTNDEALAARVRQMRNFGLAGPDTVVCAGLNGKMSEASAAMGLTSLESLDEFAVVNRRNYEIYHEELASVPGISLVAFDECERLNYHYVVAECEPADAQVSRDQLQRILLAENVVTRRYFWPACHRQVPYRWRVPSAGLDLPNTEHLAERMICLPTGTAVRPSEIATLCQIIRFVVSNGYALRELLARHSDECASV
jgi:dTDP-4-amino-4,6-dideoxygalactose transaminase